VTGGAQPSTPGAGRGNRRPAWSDWVEQSCRVVEAAGQWRDPRTFDAFGPSGRLAGGPAAGDKTSIVSFASNDYLGLSAHPEVIAAGHRALDRWGTGSGASRLVTGSRPVHRELEAALASWKGSERAIICPTGFAANLSVLSVFGTEGAHVFSDELNHASIIDGCRMARAEATVFPHRDLDHLDALLRASDRRPLIVTDTVFSMDGDRADLEALVDLAERHRALLVVDEAHAVLGPELPDTSGRQVDVLRVGTLSKTLGSLGGFVTGPSRYIELLVNRARPYIFTTAPSPADAAAALAAVGVLRSAEGADLRRRLLDHVARVTSAVGRVGRASPIVPVLIGDEARAVAASSELLARGQWVPAIRPPTVPAGTSRLRITLSALHTAEQVTGLIDSLIALGLADRSTQADRSAPAALSDQVPAGRGSVADGGARAS
jgi:8-amino-7-oxononanoate synthase